MKRYQYAEKGMVITHLFHEPGEMIIHTSDNGSIPGDSDKALAELHKQFKDFRLCTDGIFRNPTQCVEKKRARSKSRHAR